jgi:hypothetical protein
MLENSFCTHLAELCHQCSIKLDKMLERSLTHSICWALHACEAPPHRWVRTWCCWGERPRPPPSTGARGRSASTTRPRTPGGRAACRGCRLQVECLKSMKMKLWNLLLTKYTVHVGVLKDFGKFWIKNIIVLLCLVDIYGQVFQILPFYNTTYLILTTLPCTRLWF